MVNVKPEVAESWSVSNDGVTWTFKIRKGIMFHSGRELTADDVVFSLQRVLILKQTAAWVLEQFVSNPDNIKKIDDYTVQIVLDKPVAPTFFLSALTFPTSARLDKQEVLARQVGNDLGSAWLTDHSAGSGVIQACKMD
jgi:peptide/nickel transport system substrate-binding protein